MQPNCNRPFFVLTLCVTVGLLVASSYCQAQYVWDQPAFGQFSSASSWSGAVGTPGPNDTASFGATQLTTLSPNTVLFVVDGQSEFANFISGDYSMRFGNPDITYQVGERVEWTSDDEPSGFFGGVTIGTANDTPGLPSSSSLTVEISEFGFPGTIVTADTTIGQSLWTGQTPRPGLLRLEGAGTRWRSEGGALLGNGGNYGRLEIVDGASFESGPIFSFPDGSFIPAYVGIGGAAFRGGSHPRGGEGSILVSGTGSMLTAEAGIWVGVQGKGTLEVVQQGEVVTDWLDLGSTRSQDAYGHLIVGDAPNAAGNQGVVWAERLSSRDPRSVIDVSAVEQSSSVQSQVRSRRLRGKSLY